MVRSLAGCGESISVQHGFKDLHVQEKKNTLLDAQKGQPLRPSFVSRISSFASIDFPACEIRFTFHERRSS
jgi:hypothetical protein